ncbi:P-loop ATPase, Sll1717 family [Gordonia jacobaea]|uniref:ATPase n=1 Tax=Gordonia jacobaea TaxID=122202 RepID=A0ABR5IB68_9ACTN|nr:hypothetical protein [Gordonia jacobaea]KNA90947.1 hypothetical protein ABW18_11480 [Gordonia jacobaea]
MNDDGSVGGADSFDSEGAGLEAVDNVGGLEAEFDELLEDCFETHPAYLEVLDMRGFLVLGRKGTGKTAMCKQLTSGRDPEILAKSFTLQDYPWRHDNLQDGLKIPENMRYTSAWKYFLLLRAAELVVENESCRRWDALSSGSIKSLKEFIADAYGSKKPKFSKLFNSGRKAWKAKGVNAGPNMLHLAGEREEVYIPPHIQEVNRLIEGQVLSSMDPDIQYLLCFDQLDEGFSVADPRYMAMLAGLIRASRELFAASKQAGLKFSPVIFLRDDIYDSLTFDRKNQITENSSIRLRWNSLPPNDGNNLKELVERRFTSVLNADAQDVLWEDIFDSGELQDDESSPSSVFNEICESTLMRPRDVIKFLNDMLAHLRTQDHMHGTYFDNDCLDSARESYSRYLLEETKDEIAGDRSIPNQIWRVLEDVGSEQFGFDRFEEVYLGYWSSGDSGPIDVLENLFEHSVLGFLENINGQLSAVWRHSEPDAKFKRSATTFRVHRGFRESLGLC